MVVMLDTLTPMALASPTLPMLDFVLTMLELRFHAKQFRTKLKDFQIYYEN